MSYAESTKVPIEKTQADIHKLVKSQGANRYGLMEDEERPVCMGRRNPMRKHCSPTASGRPELYRDQLEI